MGGLIAVTGGTGFLGRAMLGALAREGWRLRLLVRRNPALDLPGGNEPELVFGGLDDPAALGRLVRGADAVVHAAGLIKAPSLDGFMAVNRDGSRRLGEAVARFAPDARLVVVSSLAAREPGLSGYAASKRAGEEAAVEAFGGGNWVVLRPPAIYGPGDRETLTVFRAARAPIVPLFHGPESRVCLIHADDAAAAVAALCAGGPSARVYELSDERREGYGWREVIEAAARAVGSSPRLLPVPGALVHAAASLSGGAARLTGRTAMLTPGKAREMLHPDWSSEAGRQPSPAIWQPRVRLDEGFRDTVAWYRAAGWL
ncbi:NAD-dependent epimerase/dehydratase family protein [Azospirillum sp. SYSU D00513]|uniref:NAD-dependent epimerase/dehydratase family protein n=1 Tax=Azospirillum sp. SYSU D00513 TaxID=2812561 RepID=UPI001A974153|nr:NAD-dependent epimerase/dehydratase family protein [Azospirillum sp. SYSU D00513]